LADQWRAGVTSDSRSVRQAIDFFRQFADRCHHGKEEGHLFPLLEGRGLPPENGPTSVMRDEHEQGRDLLAAMTRALDRTETGDAGAGLDLATQARAYVRLMREHIRKEDSCLFPMADKVLSGSDTENLVRSFAQSEHDDMGTGTHERYLRLADKLADRMGVPRTEVQTACGHECGHGRH
jgi:hemerythrin-like domain-containing protein